MPKCFNRIYKPVQRVIVPYYTIKYITVKWNYVNKSVSRNEFTVRTNLKYLEKYEKLISILEM